jgi:hypothetical protein
MLTEPIRCPLQVVIRGSCGFVEFYVQNPCELLAAQAEQRRNLEKRNRS